MGILGIILMPAIILIGIALFLMVNKNKKIAKILFILAGIYLLICFGTCGYVFYEFNTNGKL